MTLTQLLVIGLLTIFGVFICVLVTILVIYVRRHTKLQERHLMILDNKIKYLESNVHGLEAYNDKVILHKFAHIRQWMIDFKVPRRYWG